MSRLFSVALCIAALLGCSSQPAANSPSPAQPTAAAPSPSPAAPASRPAETPATPLPTAARASTAAPAAQNQPAKPAQDPAKTPAQQQLQPKDTIILTGAPMGGVKFEHKLHAAARNVSCETCHHPPRAEKPGTAQNQACRSCHTSVAMPPMRTKTQAAFHNPTATEGLCIACHKESTAQGKPAPTKCLQCHKKENG